ncbi:MAG TPA: DUF6350 family protein, partial [Actinomycetes bacterium]|nr:DUF6350 family protein [Actinomycetes bacterium]
MPEPPRPTRPAAGRRRAPADPRPVAAAPAAGVVAALTAAALSLLVATVAVLVAWVSATRTEIGGGDALRTAVQTWLLAHHGGLQLGGAGAGDGSGFLGLVPLGLTALPAVLLAAAAARAVRMMHVRTLRGGLPLYLALVASYAVVPVALAPLADTDDVRPLASQAFLGALVLSALAGGYGVLRGAGLWPSLRRSMPPMVRAVTAAATAATALLLGAGAVLAAASLGLHAGQVTELVRSLDPGPAGGVVLLLTGVMLVPNAVVWAAAYAIGPGFAVGAGTSVGPFAVHLGAVPAFPLLGALPSEPAMPLVALVVLLTPFAAGVVAGIIVVRRTGWLPERAQTGWAAVAGVVSGMVLGVLAALSGGPVGGGRMATVGPSPWQVGLFAALEIGLAGALTAWALPAWLRA